MTSKGLNPFGNQVSFDNMETKTVKIEGSLNPFGNQVSFDGVKYTIDSRTEYKVSIPSEIRSVSI